MRASLLVLALLLLAATPALASDPTTPTVLSLKEGDALVGDLSTVFSFEVELPDGVFARAYARTTGVRRAWDGELITTWRGSLAGFFESEILLTQRAGLNAGLVRFAASDEWFLLPDGRLERLDADHLPCGTETALEELATQSAFNKAADDTTIVTIDLGVIYDNSFIARAGGEEEAKVMIANALDRANALERDSGTLRQWKLIGMRKLSITPDPSTVLAQARYAPETESLRNSGADIIAVFAGQVTLGGIEIGGISDIYAPGDATRDMFAVGFAGTLQGLAGHEAGHGGGADHENKGNPVRPVPARAYSYCPSDGADGWGDRMMSGTTNPGCPWEGLNLHSSPTLTYKGVPLGREGLEDNAGVLRSTRKELASRRSPATAATCTGSSTKACLLGGNVAVSVTWPSNAGVTRNAVILPLSSTDTAALFRLASVNQLVLVNVVCTASKLTVTATANSLPEFTVTITSKTKSTTLKHTKGTPVPVSTSSLSCG